MTQIFVNFWSGFAGSTNLQLKSLLWSEVVSFSRYALIYSHRLIWWTTPLLWWLYIFIWRSTKYFQKYFKFCWVCVYFVVLQIFFWYFQNIGYWEIYFFFVYLPGNLVVFPQKVGIMIRFSLDPTWDNFFIIPTAGVI